jgi:transposase-like protein
VKRFHTDRDQTAHPSAANRARLPRSRRPGRRPNGSPKNLTEARKLFARPSEAREFLLSRRWPHGVKCLQCGSTSIYPDARREGWECKARHPKRRFTLKTGTIFEDSPLGLDKWLLTIWMIANFSNGIGSHELAQTIGVTQKTAWRMLQRIQLALEVPALLAPSRQESLRDK